MRIAIVGASGNIGFHLVRELAADRRVEEVVAIARRPPPGSPSRGRPSRGRPSSGVPSSGVQRGKVRWLALDVARPGAFGELEKAFRGCASVVHLAWLIQPERATVRTEATNVAGSERVFAAALATGVPALVYASSVGAYHPRESHRPVDENWPITGIETSPYSVQKVAVEHLLDSLEADHPGIRVSRLRPAIVLSAAAAQSQARYFLGPLAPLGLLRLLGAGEGRLPVVPAVRGLTFQVVHSRDAAAAFAAAATSPAARGAYNIAADPPITPETLPDMLGGRGIPLPPALLRAAVGAAYRARLAPVSPGWIDLARGVPLMDTGRARRELGWVPAVATSTVLREWLVGVSTGRGDETPVLRGAAGWLDHARGARRALSGRGGGRI
ncbi:nucleoside-diphosphate-sugar epimerase [Frankia torreyi]|uniref:Nucleoside-diphosphate-sugar epimerase n=1 Tax=Frankia torreyi TaxID=1856 RepID=A0A0D8BCH6_9ACTN|nr:MULTISPECIES: NAD-dependent epimerase/dehydratase family protein [Frankia]KJE21876.1 nucleoside-diphosphate-sugar epimerase [Frankia torreyi]KQM05253.1 nucleoside-diphosphate-sugar epimerase [Frankia sp. CpI1-P]